MPSNEVFALPFDTVGNAATNLIANEQQVINGNQNSDFLFIVPKFAPFFENDFVLSLTDVSGVTRRLDKDVDYFLSHNFTEASLSYGKRVYGSVTMNNLLLVGVLSVTYRSVGGPWTLDANGIARMLADKVHNPRVASWAQINGLPYAFPVIDHPYDYNSLVGQEQVVASLNSIASAILSKTVVPPTLQELGGVSASDLQAALAPIKTKLGI